MELLLEHFLHDLEQNPKLSKQSSPFSGQISMSLTKETIPFAPTASISSTFIKSTAIQFYKH